MIATTEGGTQNASDNRSGFATGACTYATDGRTCYGYTMWESERSPPKIKQIKSTTWDWKTAFQRPLSLSKMYLPSRIHYLRKNRHGKELSIDYLKIIT